MEADEMKKKPDPPVFYGPHIQQDRRREVTLMLEPRDDGLIYISALRDDDMSIQEFKEIIGLFAWQLDNIVIVKPCDDPSQTVD